jgi:hypothetical protein
MRRLRTIIVTIGGMRRSNASPFPFPSLVALTKTYAPSLRSSAGTYLPEVLTLETTSAATRPRASSSPFRLFGNAYGGPRQSPVSWLSASSDPSSPRFYSRSCQFAAAASAKRMLLIVGSTGLHSLPVELSIRAKLISEIFFEPCRSSTTSRYEKVSRVSI